MFPYFREEKSTFTPLEIFLPVCNAHSCYNQFIEIWEWSSFYNDDSEETDEEMDGSWNQPTMKSTSGLLDKW